MIEYRVASHEDIEQLNDLLNQLFEQEVEFTPNKAKQVSALKTIMDDAKSAKMFVACEKEKVVAMVSVLFVTSTALGAKAGILEDMIVDKKYRGEGIGSELLGFALAEVRQDGCKRVTLLTDADNEDAHRFYDAKGFEKSSMIAFRKFL